MFDIQKDSRMDIKEKLLCNIWQELKRINTPQEVTEKPQAKENKVHEYNCKVVGCDFKTENKGLYLAHCRNGHKKEGVLNG
jgi:hypothetical protein